MYGLEWAEKEGMVSFYFISLFFSFWINDLDAIERAKAFWFGNIWQASSYQLFTEGIFTSFHKTGGALISFGTY